MIQLLQKDLKIYRFKNHNPSKAEPHKYDYQLFRKRELITNIFSDNEFTTGKVTAVPGTLKMDLINHTGNISMREMEDVDTFIIPVISAKQK
jgi:hypothetical protein